MAVENQTTKWQWKGLTTSTMDGLVEVQVLNFYKFSWRPSGDERPLAAIALIILLFLLKSLMTAYDAKDEVLV